MGHATKRDREEFVGLLVHEWPGLPCAEVVEAARQLMRLGATDARLAEAACNRELTEAEVAKDKRTQQAIREICGRLPARWRVTHKPENGGPVRVLHVSGEADCWAWLHKHQSASVQHATKHEGYSVEQKGCVPVFSGDPRGATVKLQVPSGATGDWGQVGICVPTS